MSIGFRTLVPGKVVPVKVGVSLAQRTGDHAAVHIVREKGEVTRPRQPKAAHPPGWWRYMHIRISGGGV